MITPWTETRIETEAGIMPARVYGRDRAGRSAPLVLHLHGGAFTDGTLECGAMVASLLAQAGAVVVSIDYPLASTHPFPFALTAAFAALSALYRQRAAFAGKSSKLFVAGEEAGGNLAAGLAMMARDQQAPPLAGQVLISPMLDPCLATASARKAEAGVVGCKWADGWQKYLGSADKGAHPYAAPLFSARLAGLAPALVVSALDDPMRDESMRYARALAGAGVAVTLDVLPAATYWLEQAGDAPAVPSPRASEPVTSEPVTSERVTCEPVTREPVWADTLRTLFTTFFESTRPSRHSTASAVL